MDIKPVLQVSCVQLHWGCDLDENLDKTLHYIQKAAESGSDVVLFPEANLTGYDFAYLTNLSPKKITSALREVRRMAKDLWIFTIVGTIEKRGKTFLNLAHVIDDDGKMIHRYAKIQLAGADEQKYCRPGKRLAFFEILGHKCTLVICRDGRHPELYRIPAMAGARILFQPSCSSNDAEPVWWKRVSGRAQQPIGPTTHIYHCVANTVGQNRAATETSGGESFIREPNGLPLAEAGFYEETMITARLDMAKATGRYVTASMEHPRFLRKYWQMMLNEMLDMSGQRE
ncbi:MAG: carbon-nitrogen hydrolase family protein [bacterium]